MIVNKNTVLIKRAVSFNGGRGIYSHPSEIDYERSAVEESENGDPIVVLRGNANILAVFAVDGWQVKPLEPADWPDDLLDEAEAAEA